MEKLLRGAGYFCDYASDAGEPMAALEVQPYDLLIADIDSRETGSQSLSVPASVVGIVYRLVDAILVLKEAKSACKSQAW
jgi:hypothetical protein